MVEDLLGAGLQGVFLHAAVALQHRRVTLCAQRFFGAEVVAHQPRGETGAGGDRPQGNIKSLRGEGHNCGVAQPGPSC